MKQCTWCGKDYPDDASVCATDGQPLVTRAPPETATAQKEESKPWPPQVVIPAILWLLANLLLVISLGFAASTLFCWATAIWATIDSAQFKGQGRRVLGIGFTPVVVFAVCAFFLWGFGFIWYLIQRHRLKTTPFIPEAESDNIATG